MVAFELVELLLDLAVVDGKHRDLPLSLLRLIFRFLASSLLFRQFRLKVLDHLGAGQFLFQRSSRLSSGFRALGARLGMSPFLTLILGRHGAEFEFQRSGPLLHLDNALRQPLILGQAGRLSFFGPL